MNKIVVGLGFGDEGKGITTSFLSNLNPNSIVIRHNGGQQAGHTVVLDGKRHVFSQLGSGTMQGLPTYFGPECTFYLPSFIREYEMLKSYSPKVTLHPMVRLTTPFDIEMNRSREQHRVNRHGSVGMGFGQTIERSDDYHYQLYAMDMFYPEIFEAKVYRILNFYRSHMGLNYPDMNLDFERFIHACSKATLILKIQDEDYPLGFEERIFETSQGVLLDQKHGIFPNVTRSNTTSKNAFDVMADYWDAEIYYVTRTYQTRHGNGFMTKEDDIPVIINNENETNKQHDYQGKFRVSRLDHNLLRYAIECDYLYSGSGPKKNLVITCNDQLAIDHGRLINNLESNDLVKFDKIFMSYGPEHTDLKQIR